MDEDISLSMPRATTSESATAAAERVGTWLQLNDGTRWADEYEALRFWRRRIEEAGVLVFELQLGRDEVRGFAVWDPRAPMIVANVSGVAAPVRLFTLGHELAHLVLRDATACVEPTGSRIVVDDRVERWCEQFAGSLLMPRAAVRSLMSERQVAAGSAGLDDVKAVMRRFRVSARAAAVRLSDLGFATEGLYAAVLSVFRPKPPVPRSTGDFRQPPRYQTRLREYGASTIGTVFERLPEDEALSVLRLKVEDARRLAEEVPGVRSP